MKIAHSFPPLLSGHRVERHKDPVKRAVKMARAGKLGAGDLLWSEDQNRLNIAMVLERRLRRRRRSIVVLLECWLRRRWCRILLLEWWLRRNYLRHYRGTRLVLLFNR